MPMFVVVSKIRPTWSLWMDVLDPTQVEGMTGMVKTLYGCLTGMLNSMVVLMMNEAYALLLMRTDSFIHDSTHLTQNLSSERHICTWKSRLWSFQRLGAIHILRLLPLGF